ncbi:MAG: EAL domain-containing protein [Spirochaetaceae bacterium]
MRSSVIANLLACLIVSFFLWNKIPTKNLIIWAGSISFITIIRLITYYLFKNRSNINLNFFYKLFFVLMIITALLWGFSGFIIFSTNSTTNSVILICILGISLGSISSLSSDLYAIYSYQTALLIPILFRLITYNNDHNTTLAALISLFYIFILVIGTKIQKTIFQNIMFKERHKKNIEELQISESKFKTIFNHAPVGIFYFNSDLIIYDCNMEFCKILEAPKESLIDLDMHNLKDKRVLKAMKDTFIFTTGSYDGEYVTTLADHKIWITLNCSPSYDENNNIVGAVGIVQDRTEMQLAEERVLHLAYHDNLTALPNRLLLKDRIKQALTQNKRSNFYGAILFLDLDKFKSINDTLGHYIGDLILKETAERLKSILRTEDTVARIGGDEFVILLPKLHESVDSSIVSVNLVADKIHKVIKQPFYHIEKTLYTSTSIGVNIFSNDEQTIDDLLKNADTAMYEAKSNGRGSTHFFSKEMNVELSRRLELENNLRLALENNELKTFFQPIYNGITRELVGAETLLRWEHPVMGMISPVDFIPLAEETNLIIPIGEWIIEQVCKKIDEWRGKFVKKLKYISINVSVNQLRQDNFVDIMLKYTTLYNIPTEMILLEITESILIGNFNFAAKTISKLRSEGFRFALDDFGTGYSSLTYLKKLEIDVIKIDRAFVQDINNNKNDVALVEAILSLANNFNMGIVVEGVEETKQLKLLTSMGCTYFQGYYFSKPLPANDFQILLN